MVTTEAADGLTEARDLLGGDRVLVLGKEAVDLTALRPALADRGLRQLLCEGGPHLFGDLLAAGQVDELCETWVPKLLSGESSRIAVGSAVEVDLELTLLMEDDSTLLGRWLVRRDPA
jgi:riboflavin biosynthesis pyrimidine reductase